MKEVKIEKCPFCGGEELIESRVSSYGGVYIERKTIYGAALYSLICRDCGSMVRSFVKEPEKLFPKKERRK